VNDIEHIFGWRLEEILDVSQRLLAKLEVVDLIRTDPKSAHGRPGLVANAFLEIAPELHVYAPYVSAHKQGLKILDKALDTLKKKSRNLSKRTSGTNANFFKIWETMCGGSKRLKGQTIQSILITPIQRVPRYKLLLTELNKKIGDEHPAKPALAQALDLISRAATQINEALRQHERLEKFFGEDQMLAPVSSKSRGTRSNGSVVSDLTLTNVYETTA